MQNNEEFFADLHKYVCKNNDFTIRYGNETPLRISYFNNETQYPDMVSFHELLTAGGELHIPPEMKDALATTLWGSEGIKTQFITRTANLLQDKFNERDIGLLKGAVTLYIYKHGNKKFLDIFKKIFDQTNTYYEAQKPKPKGKTALSDRQEEEEDDDDDDDDEIGLGAMFGLEDDDD